MKIRDVAFIASASREDDFPLHGLPEIAFIGRSNAGKSSLINMLVGRKGAARTGSKPGVTRAVNFFTVNGRISLADLPGYGYARAPAQTRRNIPSLIRRYCTVRAIALAFILIDARRIPEREEKELFSFLLRRGVPVLIVLTKADKCSRKERESAVTSVAATFGIGPESIALTSARTGLGRKELLYCIESCVEKNAR